MWRGQLPFQYIFTHEKKIIDWFHHDFFPLTGQINDLADKMDAWENGSIGRGSYAALEDGSGAKKTEDKLDKATKDACKIVAEILSGTMTQVIKDRLFNHTFNACRADADQEMASAT